MARKTADLRLAMRRTADPAGRGAAPAPAPEAAPAAPRPGRAGKSNVTGYFPPAVKRQLRILAAERGTTIQELLGEALNDLFAKHGKPEIAPVRAGGG
jgi:hypothetical protein